MIERHIAKLKARHPLSEEEEQAVRGLVAEVREIGARSVIVREGTKLDHSILLIDGWLGRSRITKAGARQISAVHIAGDFADLHGFTLKRLDHDIQSFNRCRIALVPHERIAALIETHPRLGRLCWFQTNLDAAIHREWSLTAGRRSGDQKVAALICELQVRLALVGLSDETGFDLPLTQQDLADCLGLTPIHVNRMLRQLRLKELMTIQNGHVSILDLERLQRGAAFSPAYLYLDAEPL